MLYEVITVVFTHAISSGSGTLRPVFRPAVKGLASVGHLPQAVGHLEALAIGLREPVGLRDKPGQAYRLDKGDRAARIRRESPTEDRADA